MLQLRPSQHPGDNSRADFKDNAITPRSLPMAQRLPIFTEVGKRSSHCERRLGKADLRHFGVHIYLAKPRALLLRGARSCGGSISTGVGFGCHSDV